MKNSRYLWMAVILLLLAGCGFDNTMYNARKAFDSAQARPLNAQGRPGPEAVTEYTKTIKKCGVILTERKNSPEADDALFLLAKALYYKGNSQFQAKDQFESLKKNFPSSPFVPEATIFIALIDRQINKPQEAQSLLEAFIREPESLKFHAKALFVLADFAIQDEDYIKAQYWLDKILTEYPKTKEYKEAFFLSGKLWYEQRDYIKSLEQFLRLEKAKRIDKTIVLDARYYIALNQMLVGESKQALSTIKKLLAEEYRPDRLPLCNVLKGRIWLALGKEEEGRELLKDIIKTAPRTLASAEAHYRLAEYDFLIKHDVSAAVESYSKAKSEATASEYTAPATDKYNATNLIKTTATLKPATDLQLYLDNNLAIAENYFTLFDMPDSVFSVFRTIEVTPALIKVYEDSLTVKADSLTLSIDSLAVIVDTTEAVAAPQDTPDQKSPEGEQGIKPEKPAGKDMTIKEETDSEEVVTAVPDSADVIVKQDDAEQRDEDRAKELAVIDNQAETLPDVKTEGLTPADSLALVTEKAMADSLAAVKARNHQRFDDLRNQRTQALDEIKALQDASKSFVERQIPYALFVKASMVKRGLADSTMLVTIYEDMQTRYPEDKYTDALRMLLAGEAVRLVDPALDKEEADYDQALGDLTVTADSAIVKLISLTRSTYPAMSLKANFRLGWLYTFEAVDTAEAKPYLDEVLKLNRTSDYGALVTRFYTGTKYSFPKVDFTVVDSLMKKLAESDSTTAASIADSLAQKAKADSLDEEMESGLPEEIPEAEEEITPEETEETTPIIKPDEVPLQNPVE